MAISQIATRNADGTFENLFPLNIEKGGTGANTKAGAIKTIFPKNYETAGYPDTLFLTGFDKDFQNSGYLTAQQLKGQMGLGENGPVPIIAGGTGGINSIQAAQNIGVYTPQFGNLKPLPEKYNLNNMSAFMGYYYASASISNSLVNKPPETSGSALTIWMDTANPAQYIQFVFNVHTSTLWARHFADNKWASWQTIITPITKNLVTATTALIQKNSNDFSDKEINEMADIFPQYQSDKHYKQGDIVNYKGQLWRIGKGTIN